MIKPNITAIRILPMSKSVEFSQMDVTELQHKYFVADLYYRKDCAYLFRSSGMNAEEDTLILFQCEGTIIAQAILKKVEKYLEKKDGIYAGAYLLKKETIAIFDPINSNEMKKIWPDFNGFRQQKTVLSVNGWESFNKLLSRTNVKLAEDLSFNVLFEEHKQLLEIGTGEDDDGFPEGRFILRKHLSRERNSEVIKRAKDNFKKKNGKLYCEVCKFDFEERYGVIGKEFIEGHHIIPVSEMQEGHQTKPSDIIMVCSNCHKIIHRKRPWLKREELKDLLSVQVARLHTCDTKFECKDEK
jgi:predicted HNH restriction endonuclease